MTAGGEDPNIQLEPGSPIAQAVAEADAAFGRADVDDLNRAYMTAAELAGSGDLRSALATDHVARLLALGALSPALRRCDQYLAELEGVQLRLRLLRAEVHGAGGAHRAAAGDAAMVRDGLRERPGALTLEEQGRLLRVEGLAAADRDDFTVAGRRLDQAREAFSQAGMIAGTDAIDRDRLLIDVRQGKQAAVTNVMAALSGAPSSGPVADRLTRISGQEVERKGQANS